MHNNFVGFKVKMSRRQTTRICTSYNLIDIFTNHQNILYTCLRYLTWMFFCQNSELNSIRYIVNHSKFRAYVVTCTDDGQRRVLPSLTSAPIALQQLVEGRKMKISFTSTWKISLRNRLTGFPGYQDPKLKSLFFCS